MSGYEVARLFRRMPVVNKTLLVALTGWGSDSDREKSQDAGFDLHLTKPVVFSTVEAVLSRVDASDVGRCLSEPAT